MFPNNEDAVAQRETLVGPISTAASKAAWRSSHSRWLQRPSERAPRPASKVSAAVDRAGVALASTRYLTTQQVRPVADLIIAK